MVSTLHTLSLIPSRALQGRPIVTILHIEKLRLTEVMELAQSDIHTADKR